MALDPLIPELICTNIERSLDFYTRILGFKILYQRPEEQFAMLERENAKIMIEGMAGRKWVTGQLEYPYGRGMHFQIKVSDVESLCARIEAAGHSLFLPLEEKWYRANDKMLGNRQFIVQDPDGFLLRFAQDLGTKSIQD